jgi:hypothetical protein
MSKAASIGTPYTLEELKERGDRVIARALEAWRILNIATRDGRELYSRIERFHHQNCPSNRLSPAKSLHREIALLPAKIDSRGGWSDTSTVPCRSE